MHIVNLDLAKALKETAEELHEIAEDLNKQAAPGPALLYQALSATCNFLSRNLLKQSSTQSEGD